MSNFSFKDEDEEMFDLNTLPAVQELPAAEPPKPAAQNANAPTAPSPALPKVPSVNPTAANKPTAPSPPLPPTGAPSKPAPQRANIPQNPNAPQATGARPSASASAANAAAATPNAANAASSTRSPSGSPLGAPRQAAPGSAPHTAPTNPNAQNPNTENAATRTPSVRSVAAQSAATQNAAAQNAAARMAAAKSGAALPPLREEDLRSAPVAQTATNQTAGHNVPPTFGERVLDFLTPLVMWLLRGVLVLGGLSLAYLAYGAASGALTQGGNDLRIIGNMTIAANVLRWALFGLALCFCVLMWDERAVGVITIIAGLALLFGIPPLMRMVGNTEAIKVIAASLSFGGRTLMILGVLKCAYDLVMWTLELPSRMIGRADVGVSQRAEMRQQREAQNATMLSPCWKLPFCREVIRKQCPAYLAKKRCWKFGRGCYCDEEMISRIIRGESLDVIKAPTRMSQQGKPPCGRCHIYLEHQGLKYKVLSPLAIPITLASMYFGWPTYMALTGKIGDSMQFVWNKLSFNGTTAITGAASKLAEQTAKSNSTLSGDQVQQVAQTMFGVLLGFYFLIALSKAIEWIVYKARL